MRIRFFLVAFLWCVQAQAVTIERPLADAVQEQQAQAVFHALRCMVCEGQSLAESDAKLAVQMRAHIRTMAGEGQSAGQIEQFFRDSYGERILMAPPFEWRTALLWALPFLFMMVGGAVLWRVTRPKEEVTHD